MNAERLRRNRKVYAFVGLLKKAGHDGMQIKRDGASIVSNGRTEKSTELDFPEYLELVRHLFAACEKVGIDATPKPRAKRPGSPGSGDRKTARQLVLIKRLARPLGLTAGEIAAIKLRAKTAKQASAEIEALKSRVVQKFDLVEQARQFMTSPSRYMSRSVKERGVLADIIGKGGRGGRSIFRLKPGAILWAIDILFPDWKSLGVSHASRNERPDS